MILLVIASWYIRSVLSLCQISRRIDW